MSGAVISDCGLYRYTLSRDFGPQLSATPSRSVCWVMVNPSTADADRDDPTIRRVAGFSRSWGLDRVTVSNLFAYRATDPADLIAAADAGVDIVGPDHRGWLLVDLMLADAVVVAWGATVDRLRRRFGPLVHDRITEVRDLLHDLDKPAWCIGVTKSGEPRHPLMVAKATPLAMWGGPGA